MLLYVVRWFIFFGSLISWDYEMQKSPFCYSVPRSFLLHALALPFSPWSNLRLWASQTVAMRCLVMVLDDCDNFDGGWARWWWWWWWWWWSWWWWWWWSWWWWWWWWYGGDDGGIDGWGKMRMMAMMIAMRMMATVMVNGEDGDQEQETHSLITLCLIITEYPVSHQCL